jgi:hypothetical protein
MSVWGLALDRSGRLLAVGESGPRVQVLDLAAGGRVTHELVRAGQGYERRPYLAFSPEGELLAASVTSGSEKAQRDHVLVWDFARPGAAIASLTIGESVQAMAMGRVRDRSGAALLGVGTRNGAILLYALDPAKPVEAWGPVRLEGPGGRVSRGAHLGRVRGLQFGGWGKLLLSASAGDARGGRGRNEICLWHFRSRSVEGRRVGAASFGSSQMFEWVAVHPGEERYRVCMRDARGRERDVVQVRWIAGLEAR